MSKEFPEQPRSWNTHALITRMALGQHYDPILKATVQVISIEEFFALAANEITDIVDLFRNMVSRNSGCESGGKSLSSTPSSVGILKILKLNPAYEFSYVRILRPEEISPSTPHNPGRNGPPGGMYIPTADGANLSAADVLMTYADEPDWGMDQDLFPMPEYGFGRAPFGVETGKSSQAPFHMGFLHEREIVGRLVPDLRKTFMRERIVMYLALARIGFAHGVHYWGWRFAGWAMHYLQDLTQPYHAKAWPVVIRPLLGAPFLPSTFVYRIRNLGLYLKNHHLLFEATTHFMLNEITKKDAPHAFRSALLGDNQAATGNLEQLMTDCSRFAANHARELDSVLVRLVRGTDWKDPEYFFQEHPDFRMESLFSQISTARPHLFEQFVDLVSRCLSITGNVTRYAVNSALPPDSRTKS